MADDILSTSEIEYIIENFKPSGIEEIGSNSWFKGRERLCKLYQVAVIEVRTEGPERIKSALSVYNRTTDFVKELITLSVWKEKVLPEILAFSPMPEQSFPVYIILYSEVMLVGLLEAILFHGEMFWDLGDMCNDLIDYAVDKIINLSTKHVHRSDSDIIKEGHDPLREIKNYESEMNLTIAASSITLLRFFAENFDKVSLSVASRIFTHYDVPLVVARLLETSVWSYKEDGRLYKFENNKWREWRCDDPLLSHIECQTWLLIRQLLLNSTCDTVYYYSEYRKEQLSKLTRLLYDNIIDQLSPLADLKIWLHRLSISNTQQDTTSNPLIMEISETYHDKLINGNKGQWNKIAMDKAKLLLYPSQDDVVKLAKCFAGGIDGMEAVAESINSCSSCFAKALKRCSKCRKVWYCSRKCQVEHWKIHKKVCCE